MGEFCSSTDIDLGEDSEGLPQILGLLKDMVCHPWLSALSSLINLIFITQVENVQKVNLEELEYYRLE